MRSRRPRQHGKRRGRALKRGNPQTSHSSEATCVFVGNTLKCEGIRLRASPRSPADTGRMSIGQTWTDLEGEAVYLAVTTVSEWFFHPRLAIIRIISRQRRQY